MTFTTPLASRKVAQGHAYPATLSPLSHHNSVANDVCNVDTPKENEALADGDGGKVAPSSSVELLTQQTVEQAMMTNIGTKTNCSSSSSSYLTNPPLPPPLLSYLFSPSSPSSLLSLFPLIPPFPPLLSFPSSQHPSCTSSSK